MVFGLLSVLYVVGFVVLGDVSVVGFDDILDVVFYWFVFMIVC